MTKHAGYLFMIQASIAAEQAELLRFQWVLEKKEVPSGENNSHLCSVIKTSDGRELCRIMIAMESAAN